MCPAEDMRASGSAPASGREKDSQAIVRETYRVLDKLFPRFLEGNIGPVSHPLGLHIPTPRFHLGDKRLGFSQ